MSTSVPKAVAWRLLDEIDARRGKVLPPRRLRNFVGAGDLEAVGAEFLAYCVELGGLAPHDRVLDVGSGIGRLALPFSRYLEVPGCYLGVDSWPTGVAWCTDHVGAAFPNFTFQLLDIFDEKYNPLARAGDEAISIDAPAGSFDFATLISILHLKPERIRRYLGELGRLLRPGGTYVGTWYLLGHEDERDSDGVPGAAVSEEVARAMMSDAGLDVIALHYGRWAGRPDGLSYQDIVVGRRRP